MRPAPNPIISAHKLARLHVWARLYVCWFAHAAQAWWRGAGPRALDGLARMVGKLILVSAAARVAPYWGVRYRQHHHRQRAARLRACFGAALRRALAGKTWAARFFAILTVLRDAPRHIAKLARRLRRGLTRLRVILPRAEAAPRGRDGAVGAAFRADTS